MKKSVKHDMFLMKYLKNEKWALGYLNAALEEKDADTFELALRNVIRAQRKMSYVAKKTNSGRESLYKSLSKKGNPAFPRVRKMVEALGLQFHLRRQNPHTHRPHLSP